MGEGTGTGNNSRQANSFTEAQKIINLTIANDKKQLLEEGGITLLEFGDIIDLYESDKKPPTVVVEVKKWVSDVNPGIGVTTMSEPYTEITYWLLDFETKKAQSLSVRRWIRFNKPNRGCGIDFDGKIFHGSTKLIDVEFIHAENGDLKKLRFKLSLGKVGFIPEIKI
jgi:hypothetical protein